jgi:hypothetical protein
MRAPILLAVFATSAPFTAGVSSALAQDRLPMPPFLEESLAWRADPEIVLQAFTVRPAPAEASRRQAATHLARVPDGSGIPRRRKTTTEDVAIAADPAGLEVRPSLATSPRRQNVIVAAYTAAAFPTVPGVRCLASTSFDRGQRWSEPVRLPTLSPSSVCGTPSLAYSPDGKHLYAAYQDQRVTTTFLTSDGRLVRTESDTDVVLTRSRDDGETWTPPVRALDAVPLAIDYRCTPAYPDGCVVIDWTPGSSYDRPSLAPGEDAGEARSVYVAATRLPEGDFTAPPTTIVVAVSRDSGATWGPPQPLDTGQLAGGGSPVVITQGPRVATGPRGALIVAWYHSGIDGPQFGSFDIRVRQSGDGGETWDPVVAAATAEHETGLFLGSRPYKRWWTTMFPAALIDREGRAHVVYTQDPEPLAATAEEGDIRYVTSTGPPFTSWSLPVDVNDDGLGRAQGFASLATRRHGRHTVVEAVWEDTRLAPDSAPGMSPAEAQLSLYDVFHARIVRRLGTGWSDNRRVSDASSVQNAANTNDRTALAANDSGVVFAVWSDRRSETGPLDPGDDLFGSRIP